MSLTLRRGARIRLLSMPKDPDPVPEGSEGTVTRIVHFSDWSQVCVDWDNGRKLMLSVPPDVIELIG